MKRRKLLLGALMLVTVLATAGPAHGQTPNQSFTLIIHGEPHIGPAIATGRFVGIGTIEEPVEDVGLLTFASGTLTFLGLFDEESTEFDDQTCVGVFTTSGRYVVTEGTGIFEGATGGGYLSGRAIFVTERTPEGCSEKEIFAIAVFYLTGTLYLSGDAAG
ncbi:MAG: hypothetical protein M3203_11975 [Actinomycetota bacterium]|nr:hypothetical protein [Actinomycetota bacterium]